MCHDRFELFTTKLTKDTKGSDIELSNFVLFVSFVVESSFTVNPEVL